MGRLLSNRVFNLHNKNDLFGVIGKAKLIKEFLLRYHMDVDSNNMIALFGNWGSGKSTVFNYLKNELSKHMENKRNKNGKFVCYHSLIFEAWKYENDNNLAQSLFENIVDEFGDIRENNKNRLEIFREKGLRNLKSFTKSVTVNLPGVELNLGELYNNIEKDDIGNSSLYSNSKQFESLWSELLKSILGSENAGNERLIVFIDDLDRCESENIISLLSMIKLFFTFEKSIIFFIGLDKDAVSKALCSKYGDIIKADEYLEKIFDITFNMPLCSDVSNFISTYFGIMPENFVKLINDLFIQLSFTNPRHIKKVFNRYEMIKKFSEISKVKIDEKKDIIKIVFLLYIIILYDFYPADYLNTINYIQRFMYYKTKVKNDISDFKFAAGKTMRPDEFYDVIIKLIPSFSINQKSFNKHSPSNFNNSINGIIYLMSPQEVEVITVACFYSDTTVNAKNEIMKYLYQFEIKKRNVCLDFCKYLVTHIDDFSNTKEQEDIHLLDFLKVPERFF